MDMRCHAIGQNSSAKQKKFATCKTMHTKSVSLYDDPYYTKEKLVELLEQEKTKSFVLELNNISLTDENEGLTEKIRELCSKNALLEEKLESLSNPRTM